MLDAVDPKIRPSRTSRYHTYAVSSDTWSGNMRRGAVSLTIWRMVPWAVSDELRDGAGGDATDTFGFAPVVAKRVFIEIRLQMFHADGRSVGGERPALQQRKPGTEFLLCSSWSGRAFLTALFRFDVATYVPSTSAMT